MIVLCNIVLGTYWLTLLNGKGFLAILPARAIKNLIQWPVDSLIFFLVAKTLEQAGVFKLILHAGNRQEDSINLLLTTSFECIAVKKCSLQQS